jgi:hypothetical protein
MRSIQSLAAQAGREARANGLPCGGYTYADPLKAKDNESGAIAEKFGTIANWRLWDEVLVKERATGRTVHDNEIAKITGMKLHAAPAEVLATLDPSIYEVKA